MKNFIGTLNLLNERWKIITLNDYYFEVFSILNQRKVTDLTRLGISALGRGGVACTTTVCVTGTQFGDKKLNK